MKLIKIRQKKCESLKQTASPVILPDKEQHLQDAGKTAASRCVSVPVLSLGSAEKRRQKEMVATLAEPHLGKVKANEPLLVGKMMCRSGNNTPLPEMCLCTQPRPAGMKPCCSPIAAPSATLI